MITLLKSFFKSCVFWVGISVIVFGNVPENPFLRPGSNKPSPPKIVKPTPLPPSPVPRNSNLEFRGYFKLNDQWNFSVFDKSTSKGIWLKKGETSHDGAIQIVGFDPQRSEIRLKNGMSLLLKDADKSTLSVPSGQISKKSTSPPSNALSKKSPAIPPPRRR